jgi:hypothetical protein
MDKISLTTTILLITAYITIRVVSIHVILCESVLYLLQQQMYSGACRSCCSSLGLWDFSPQAPTWLIESMDQSRPRNSHTPENQVRFSQVTSCHRSRLGAGQEIYPSDLYHIEKIPGFPGRFRRKSRLLSELGLAHWSRAGRLQFGDERLSTSSTTSSRASRPPSPRSHLLLYGPFVDSIRRPV